MNWQNIYRLPLTIDHGSGDVVAKPNPKTGFTQAFDWIENQYISEYPIGNRKGADIVKTILDCLNGISEVRPAFKFSCETEKDPTVILMNGEPCMIIRGHGLLTGVGGYHLSETESDKIQNEFRDWIIKKLNGEIK